MPTPQEVFKAQQDLSNFEDKLHAEGASTTAGQQSEFMARREAVARKQAEIGGKVYRVPAENLNDLSVRLEKLSKRAAKLGMDPVTYEKVATEDQEIKNHETVMKVINWVYIILRGKAPTVEGYIFVAALDHTFQHESGDPVLIRKSPMLAEKFESLDITEYRHAESKCDHCGYQRNRNATYLIFNSAEDKMMQVGSTCVKDFIPGANDPNRVARYAEFLMGLDYDLDMGGSEGGASKSARSAWYIVDYLAHVAACIRVNGWTGRGQVQYGGGPATADQAWTNLNPQNKFERDNQISLEDDDFVVAQQALTWARAMGNKDELSEFEHNMMVVTSSEYMPRKGDGIVAYAVEGFHRHLGKEVERKAEEERTANAEPCPQGRALITGTVLKRDVKHNDYTGDVRHVMWVLDDRGFKVWGTIPSSIINVNEGDKIRFTANISPKEEEPTIGFYKRPTQAEVIKEVANA
jgi:hypothetical protein